MAWWLGTAIYQIGSRIKNETFNLSNVIIIGIIVIAVVLILSKRDRNRECVNCSYVNECDKS